MASFKKTAKGWRVEVCVKGVRASSSFTTKAQAQAWAAQRETEIRTTKASNIVPGKTVLHAFERYELEVSRQKRGYRWEALRLNALAKVNLDGVCLGDILLANLTASHIARLRDVRLQVVQSSTVNRELNLLSHVLSTAVKEWHWMEASPTNNVRRPKDPEPRSRRPSEDEIERLCLALGFAEEPAKSKSECVAIALLFAIETAMRAGEICALTQDMIDGRVVHLPATVTKNGTRRDVALSTRAVQLLGHLPKTDHGAPIFQLKTSSLDALFRKAKARCLIEGLTFHDTRHEAITRLARKLNVLELARMVGHRDLKMLQIYYNESAASIAKRLD